MFAGNFIFVHILENSGDNNLLSSNTDNYKKDIKTKIFFSKIIAIKELILKNKGCRNCAYRKCIDNENFICYCKYINKLVFTKKKCSNFVKKES